MKFLKVFLFVALIAATVSCKSDDDNTSTDANLAGTWVATGIDITTTNTTEFMGVSLTLSGVGTATNIDYMVTLAENPNNVSASGSYDLEITITAPGLPTQTQTLTNQMPVGGGTWMRNGNTVSFTDGGVTDVANIDVLTETNLQLSISEEEVTSQPGGGTLTESSNLVMTFTRQ